MTSPGNQPSANCIGTLSFAIAHKNQESQCAAMSRPRVNVFSRAFQFGQKKVSIRFDSIRQSDKFAACTLIFK